MKVACIQYQSVKVKGQDHLVRASQPFNTSELRMQNVEWSNDLSDLQWFVKIYDTTYEIKNRRNMEPFDFDIRHN